MMSEPNARRRSSRAQRHNGRNIMRSHLVIAAVAAAGLAASIPVRAGGDKILFPYSYAEGVRYMEFDHAASKTFRELYTSPEAAVAAAKGEPLPDRTVIISVNYAVKLDAQGNPEKDANGRFVKTDTIAGYGVMEKRAGWGSEYPDNVRNGEWEYQVFKADQTPNTAAKLGACFECHKPQAKQDFVFSYDTLKGAAK
jgi:Cytochrome P460